MIVYRYADEALSVEHINSEKKDNDNYEMHVHHQAEILLLLKGQCTFHVEGTRYEMKEGDLIAIRPNEMHFNEPPSSGPYERVIISFNTDLFKDFDTGDALTSFLYKRREGQYNLYCSAYENDDLKKEFDTIITPSSNNKINSIASLLRILLLLNDRFAEENAESEPSTIIEKIIRYINNNLDKNLTIQNVSDMFYISRSQFCRVFKSTAGMSFGDYVIAKRMAAAHEKIRNGAKPSEIYVEYGFTDYSSFFRCYKKYYGFSPKQTKKFS